MAGRLLRSFSYFLFIYLRLERVAFFAVLAEIEALLLGIVVHAHANQDVANLEDNECAHACESEGDQNADRLVQNLSRIAVDQTQRNYLTVNRRIVYKVGGEYSGQQGACGPADTVDTEGVERIVVTEHVLDGGHHQVADDASDQPDQQCRHRLDEAGCGGDGNQSRNRARDAPEHTGLTGFQPFGSHPPEGGGSSGEVGGDERARGEPVGGSGTARVESEPADPQQTGADNAQHYAVRLHGFMRVALALSEIQRADQRGYAGSNVYHGAAGEVEGGDASAQIGVQKTALAPDHVRHREINDERPERRKQDHGAEFHALRVGPGNQRGRDHGEHELIDHVGQMGYGGGIIGVGIGSNAVQERVFQAADERYAFAEDEAVADQSPDHGDQTHQQEAVHHGGEHVLAPDEAAVEKGEPGTGHQQHQGRARQHPGVIAGGLCGFYGGFKRGEAHIQIGRCLEQGDYRGHLSSRTWRSNYYRPS